MRGPYVVRGTVQSVLKKRSHLCWWSHCMTLYDPFSRMLNLTSEPYHHVNASQNVWHLIDNLYYRTVIQANNAHMRAVSVSRHKL